MGDVPVHQCGLDAPLIRGFDSPMMASSGPVLRSVHLGCPNPPRDPSLKANVMDFVKTRGKEPAELFGNRSGGNHHALIGEWDAPGPADTISTSPAVTDRYGHRRNPRLRLLIRGSGV